MFLRLIYQSFWRQRRRKLLAGIAIALGVSVATAMIAVANNIGDKINRELRSFGANLVVYPDSDKLDVEIGGVTLRPVSDSAYLNEADLPKIEGMFWRNNVVGFAPMLPVPVDVGLPKKVELIGTYFNHRFRYQGEEFSTGVRTIDPWWKVNGDWPDDSSRDILVGEHLAAKLGRSVRDYLSVSGRRLRIAGVLSTGGSEDDAIIAPISLAQEIAGRPGAVRRVYVSALTKPEDALAGRDPRSMSPETFDRWYCSPYVSSIAYQLMETIPHSKAEQIRQVAQNEGKVLARIKGLMLLVTVAALLASALAVSAAMAAAIFERRREIGLMKALGAGKAVIAALLFGETAVLAVVGGLIGFGAGTLLAQQVGNWIFNSQIPIQPVLIPIILPIAVVVAFAGSVMAIRRAMTLDPVPVLRGDA